MEIANGVNHSGFKTGEAVGVYYSDLGTGESGFIWSEGAGSQLPISATYTTPFAINNLGQVVGQYSNNDDDDNVGFVWSAGAGLSVLTYPGAAWTELYGINDAGWIVGGYGDEAGGAQCALFKPVPTAPGDYYATPFGAPGAPGSSYCDGINGMGQIVGSYWTDPSGDAYTGFVDDAEGGDPGDAANFRTVVAPESPITQPLGINNDGLIAGNAEIGGPDSLQSGFLLDAGEFISVILPASYESNVFGLNDDVQVVGSSFAGCSEDGCPYINGFILDTQH